MNKRISAGQRLWTAESSDVFLTIVQCIMHVPADRNATLQRRCAESTVSSTVIRQMAGGRIAAVCVSIRLVRRRLLIQTDDGSSCRRVMASVNRALRPAESRCSHV